MAIRRHKEVISREANLDEGWEACIYDLFNPKNHSLGEEFFESAILSLSRYLNADYVFVAQLQEEESVLETVARCNRETIVPNTTFCYKDTPCEKVLGEGIFTYNSNVREKFPLAISLKDMEIEAYCGVPIYNSSRKPIGVLTALFSDSIDDAKKIEALMFMFSSRIGSELEHLEKQRELKRRNLELLVFKEELIRKNKELDKINKELKEASKKVEESDMLKSSFLANLSHEVRTPMNAIIGFTELLKSNNLSSVEKAEYLNIIHQNGNQLMRVMDALIDISKLQTKVYVEPKEKVRINTLISQLSANYTEEIAVMQKPLEINLLFGNDDGKDVVDTHKEALYKIFDHLLSNAIKFTAQGEIYIGYTAEEDHYEFFVKDTGIGIPAGHERSIFDLFRQADLNNSREFGGNGIGLSIVKKYTQIMGGNVWAEPNQQDGALLKFTIPR
ncbi:sensor histidine kinase [Labilibacter marinus]|uniref:sensor histidine kinase n=1 Tax=Labilibacter marinus TaxID=1477105 RepID=UPI00094FB8C1|nr:ATP-binding protein [Labilibacter marinus]